MSEPRGKTQRLDTFHTEIPSRWLVEGSAFQVGPSGLILNGNVSLRQRAQTTFGFFRFSLILDINPKDKVELQLVGKDQSISLQIHDDYSVMLYDGQTLVKTATTEPQVVVQWVLNDERFSCQLIGKSITTLASRHPFSSFYDQPYEVSIQTSFSHESTLRVIESLYEYVVE